MGEVLHPVERWRVGFLHVVLVHLDDLVVAVELDAHLPLGERLPCLALLDLATRSKTISEKFMGEILIIYPILESAFFNIFNSFLLLLLLLLYLLSLFLTYL